MDIWKFDLRRGRSRHPREGACLLDAVSWLEYGTLGDHPPCVCPVIAAYARGVNDLLPDDRRQELKPMILRLPGTVDPGSEQERAEFLVWRAVRVFAPAALDAVTATLPEKGAATLREHTAKLRGIENKASTPDLALKAASAAAGAAYNAYAAYAATPGAAALYSTSAATPGAAAAALYSTSSSTSTAAAALYAVFAAARNVDAVNVADAADAAVSVAADAAYAARRLAAVGADADEIYDSAIAALEGVLLIGRQAEPVMPESIERANRSFALART